MAACSEDLLFGDKFNAILAIFCTYRCVANASQAVQKIAIDEKNFCITNAPCVL